MSAERVTNADLTNMLGLTATAWHKLTGQTVTFELDPSGMGSHFTLYVRNADTSRSSAPGVEAGGHIGKTKREAWDTLSRLQRAWFDAARAIDSKA